MSEHSAKFQINSVKDVTVVAGTMLESGRAITPSKMAKTKIKNHMHIFISSDDNLQNSKLKNVGGVAWTRFRTDGRVDGWTPTRTDESHFYSPPSPTSGDDNKLGKRPLGIATYLI